MWPRLNSLSLANTDNPIPQSILQNKSKINSLSSSTTNLHHQRLESKNASQKSQLKNSASNLKLESSSPPCESSNPMYTGNVKKQSREIKTSFSEVGSEKQTPNSSVATSSVVSGWEKSDLNFNNNMSNINANSNNNNRDDHFDSAQASPTLTNRWPSYGNSNNSSPPISDNESDYQNPNDTNNGTESCSSPNLLEKAKKLVESHTKIDIMDKSSKARQQDNMHAYKILDVCSRIFNGSKCYIQHLMKNENNESLDAQEYWLMQAITGLSYCVTALDKILTGQVPYTKGSIDTTDELKRFFDSLSKQFTSIVYKIQSILRTGVYSCFSENEISGRIIRVFFFLTPEYHFHLKQL